ncbi:GTP-binding protein [Methanobacterium congolense]|jgi:small GTP-binding protein|uniref:Miro domain-containing protein MTH_765 n=1 Tax=Methanobacterium congolense TaxID=118062 RepID=A0A1D3L2J6_9EURY|nr:Miro domain-containing protein MTH_765 [Methanobacterium congolense]
MVQKKKGTKIVILGSADSGKTTTIENLLNRKKEKITKIECKGTTVALDYGNTIINGQRFHIFATPGQERFQFMREILSNGLDGAIVVIDNSEGVTNTDIKILENLNSSNVPYVIFSNKQDISPGKIESTHINPDIPVIPTTATTGEGIQEGLNILLDLMEN